MLRAGPYWHLFPTYTEAKNAVWLDPNMLFSVIPKELISKKNEAELRVHLINGSYIQLIGTDNPDRLRGAGPLGMVLDEYDMMKQDVWPILEPILRQNGGWAWFIGTPKGKQKLYDMYQYARSGHDPEWGAWHLPVSTSHLVPFEQIENSRRSMPESLFNQEWECAFLEGQGSVFRNVRRVATAEPERPISGELYVMGVDLAKVQDYTVITVYKRSTRKQVYQDRFQTLEWPFQKRRIKAIADKYNHALVVLDATGIGDPIADDLMRAGVAVNPFTITNTSKKEIIEKLSIFIEQQKIEIIPVEETFVEFDNFSYSISHTGKIMYNAREGYHDDIVIAHALAVWELYDIKKKEDQSISPIRQELIKRARGRDTEEYEYF